MTIASPHPVLTTLFGILGVVFSYCLYRHPNVLATMLWTYFSTNQKSSVPPAKLVGSLRILGLLSAWAWALELLAYHVLWLTGAGVVGQRPAI